MKKRNEFLGLMLVTAVMFFVPSCSKEDDGDISGTDIALAQDEAYVEAMYDELDDLVFTEMKDLDDNDYVVTGLKSTFEDVCFTVTVNHPDTTTFPKEVIIDFGEGCTVVFNGDTITRSGQIIVTLTNRWFAPDAQQIMTFNNFYFNGARVEGTRTMTNNGLNERNRLEISIQLVGGKVTFGDAYMTRTANHVREWARHINPLNDTIYVTGSAEGMNVLGEAYSRVITDPLVLVRCAEFQYRWMVSSGQVEITNSTRGNMTITHSGNGCSGDVTVEKDGNQYEYQFRYRYQNSNINN